MLQSRHLRILFLCCIYLGLFTRLKYVKMLISDMLISYDYQLYKTYFYIIYLCFEKIEAATRRLESVCRIHLQNLFRFMEYKLSLLNFIYLRINQNNQSNIFNIPLESHFICIKNESV